MNQADGNSGSGWMLVFVHLVVNRIGLGVCTSLLRLGRRPGGIVIERRLAESIHFAS
jgi:hypothetical protein